MRVLTVGGLVLPLLISGSVLAQTAGAQFPAANLAFPNADLAFPNADFRFPVTLDVRETAQEIRIELAADVLFDFDKAEIRPDAAATLTEAAALIRQRSGAPVRVEGHTDSKGGDVYNQKLSERRAQSVARWLTERAGLKTTVFRIEAFGARQPVAPNQKPDGSDDPEGRQKNRRVSLVIQK